jgi:hypothetical protein
MIWPDTPSLLGRERPAVTETTEPMPAQIDQQQLAQQLVDRARADELHLWAGRAAQKIFLASSRRTVVMAADTISRVMID